MPDCPSLDENAAGCTCTYEPCPRKGRCCECVQYHKSMGEAPGCLFPASAERTYDRSLKHLARVVGG
ncbi:MAG: DUF6485 family protein [Candidatus Eisenbacteria bacterium]